jgi:fluoride exporter
LKTLIIIALGGGIGSVLRYLTALLVNKYFASSFPYATFLTNIFGCLLIGLFCGLFEKNINLSSELRFFLVTGFCGGYTTFSTFSNENIQLLESNQMLIAFLYMGLSVFVGLIATWFGLWIVKTI